jgi:hypothetical protein
MLAAFDAWGVRGRAAAIHRHVRDRGVGSNAAQVHGSFATRMGREAGLLRLRRNTFLYASELKALRRHP